MTIHPGRTLFHDRLAEMIRGGGRDRHRQQEPDNIAPVAGMIVVAARGASIDLITVPRAAAQNAADICSCRRVLSPVAGLVGVSEGRVLAWRPRTEQAPRPLLAVPGQVLHAFRPFPFHENAHGGRPPDPRLGRVPS